MRKLTADDPESKSVDLIAENIERLKDLFPEAFTEGKIDFEVLKQLLGGSIDESEEKYGLNWHGKRQARRMALTPSTGTLRPCPEESVDWDKTQHLMIEGDNLEVLKLLQKSYAGKVKLIYIDPPYNTGKDFIYPDDYRDNIKNYLERTGQTDGEGRKNVSNPESSGRFHTDWLNMMYPRIKLARFLLMDEGVIFITIDDGELVNLKLLCNDIFGEENFVGSIVWHKKRGKDNSAQFFSKVHDYILCYARNIDKLELCRLELDEMTKKAYRNPDNDPRGDYRTLGLWSRGGQGGSRYEYTTKEGYYFKARDWLVGLDKMKDYDDSNKLIRVGDNLYRKFFLTENEGSIPESIWTDASNNANASDELKSIFGVNTPFDTPKPLPLIEKMIRLGGKDECIILDFFAGSGTTGHATIYHNSTYGGKRRYILVQLSEPLNNQEKDSKSSDNLLERSFKLTSIADLTKERLRRAGKKIREANPLFAGDLGFRVFKLSSTNIREWDPERDKIPQTLLESVDHLKSDRTDQDILSEIILKLGLDLSLSTEQKTIAGKVVHAIGSGALFVCLEKRIELDDVPNLGHGIAEWHKMLAPAGATHIVFRDSAFADDSAKANITAILKQHGLENVRSI